MRSPRLLTPARLEGRNCARPFRSLTRLRVVIAAICTSGISLISCEKRDEPFELLDPPPRSATLQRYWSIPDFSLVERTGAPLTHSDLRGKVWVADFFYTTCPGPCPMMTSRLSDVHQAVKTLDDVRLVSISTDPAKDTPEVLQAYAQKFGANERWLFATGEKTAIFTLANKGFKLAVTEEGGTPEEPVTHSTKLVLVDKNGTVRGFYESATPETTDRLVADIARLRQESR